MMSMKNFIEKFITLMHGNDNRNPYKGVTDAPKELDEAMAIFILSSAVRRQFQIASLPQRNIFGDTNNDRLGKLLNAWIIPIGKSRITHKSTVESHGKDLIRETIGHEYIISDSFSPEALVSDLSEYKTAKGTTPAFWMLDEAQGFFQKISKKNSYMKGVDSTMSVLYDGSTYSQTTTRRGEEVVVKPYLTSYLSSTPILPTLFNESKFRAGFMNRYIFVHCKKKARRPERRTPLNSEEEELRDELKGFIKSIDDFVRETNGPALMIFTSDAKEAMQKHSKTIEHRIDTKELGFKGEYLGNIPNIVEKVSALHHIAGLPSSKIDGLDRKGINQLQITKSDLAYGIDYGKRAWSWYNEIITMMQTHTKSRPVKSSANVFTKTKRCIYDADGRISRSELLRATEFKSELLDGIIITLKERNEIERKVEGQGKPGRNKTIYELTEEGEESLNV